MIFFDALWFFLPAGIANMAPVIAARLPVLRHWQTPIDLGVTWRGKPLFGKNKTWRGLLFGTLCAGLVALLQFYLFMPYVGAAGEAILLGLSLGFGALAGDAIASFFKRQRGVPAGKSWIPFDQTDYILGGLALAYPVAHGVLTLPLVLTVIVLYGGLHVLVSYIGYLLGLKKSAI